MMQSYLLPTCNPELPELSRDGASAFPSGAGTRLLTNYLQVLRRHRTLLVFCVCTSVLLSLGFTFAAHPEYEASTQIGVDLNHRDQLGNEKPFVSDGTDISMRLETQLQMAQSDVVAEHVIDQLHLAENCAFSKSGCGQHALGFENLPRTRRSALLAAYHAALHAEILPRTQIMQLRFRSKDPQLAADIVNAVANDYIDQSFRTQLDSMQKASAWLNTQLADVKRQAETAQAKLAAYQQQTGVIGTDETHNVAMNRVDDINHQLSTALSDRIIKEARYRAAESGDPELVADAVPDSVIHVLRKQQADLRGQYSVLTSRYDDNYPAVIESARQLRDVEVSIDHEVERIRTQLREQYEAARKSETMLQTALDRQAIVAMRVDSSAARYALLREDVQTSRDLYESLVKKLKEASVDQGLRSSDLQLLGRAAVPSLPVSPRLPVNLTLGLASGLLIGIVSAFMRDGFDQSIRSPEEIESLSSLPALGMIPHISEGSTPRPKLMSGDATSSGSHRALPIALEQPMSQAVEAYRAFRTALLTSGARRPRVICFVSGNGQEGKSTTAVNTSIVLAQQGNRVLLVDADLRCPTLHKYLHVQGATGLSDALMKGTLKPSIDAVHGANLFFLPAGTGSRPRYISEAFGSPQMEQLVRSWRDAYDYVIIDTPPLLAFTDGVVIAGLADACVVVTRFTETSRMTLRHVKQLLERAKVRVTGAVLNDVRLNAAEYARYYDQRSYERYEKAIVA